MNLFNKSFTSNAGKFFLYLYLVPPFEFRDSYKLVPKFLPLDIPKSPQTEHIPN